MAGRGFACGRRMLACTGDGLQTRTDAPEIEQRTTI